MLPGPIVNSKQRICRAATGLHRRGARYHDAVLVLLPNGVPFVESLFTCMTGGLTCVSVPHRSTGDELRHFAKSSNARWMITDRASIPKVDEAGLTALPEDHRFLVDGEGPAPWQSIDALVADGENRLPPLAPSKRMHSIAFTSGTTGTPKGAKRNLANAGLSRAMDFLSVVPFHHDDVHLVCCPLYHASAVGMAQLHLMLGASLVIERKFDPIEWLQLVANHRVTTTSVVPTMIHDLVELDDATFRRFDVSSLRIMLTTGSPLTNEQRSKVRKRFGDVLYDMFGSTEWAWLSVAVPEDHLQRPGTIGRPVPGVAVKIVDQQRREVETGVVGELFAKTPLQIEEYHNDPKATDEALLDGYISVGDLVRQDEQGYLFLADRKTDMVISGGVNLYPPEIEAALLTHPAVRDVAIIGVPDPRFGEQLLAYVVLDKQLTDGPSTESALIDFLRPRLSGPKIPREYRFVDTIPRSQMGKILKRELREQYVTAKGTESESTVDVS